MSSLGFGVLRAALIVLAGLCVGCGDDSSNTGGAGGMGGAGGVGGAGGAPAEVNVTIVHLAPGVPMVGDTEVTIYVDGEASDTVIAYGESTGRMTFPPGFYEFGLGTADAELATLVRILLVDGDDALLAAIRDNSETPPVDGVSYNLIARDLDPENGRVVITDAADTPSLNPLNFINVEDCPPPLFPNLRFGFSGQFDLPAGEYTFGLDFDVQSGADCMPDTVFDAPVAPALTSIFMLVDEGVDGEGPSPQVWEVVEAEEPVALIP